MSLDRVRYYSKDNMLYGYCLGRIETISVPDYNDIDINDAIESDQINKYFQKGIPEKAKNTWTDEQLKEYSEKSKKLHALANRFFNNLNDENIVDQYSQIERCYISVFWEIFNSRKLFDRLTEDNFKKILQNHEYDIPTILNYPKIVEKYGTSLREYILNHFSCIDVLLQYCEPNTGRIENKICLPEELSQEDITDFFNRYLESEQVNPNYADAIYLMHNNKKIQIEDELRLKAKRRAKQEWNKKMSDSPFCIHRRISVCISCDQKEVLVVNNKDDEIYYSYSAEWLSETLDYPSLLNNFIYVFEFVDFMEMRSLHLFKESESNTFERAVQSDSKNIYPGNFVFNMKNDLATMQMGVYYEFLLKHKIRYEKVVEWFFKEYLHKEFGCQKMRLSMPSKNSTMLEKCQTICAAIEIVVKQFSQYATKHTIDFELLNISSNSVPLDQIPSLLEGKYIYGKGKDLEKWLDLLFSDQCFLIYNSNNKNYIHHYFLDLLINEPIYKKDYSEGEQLYIEQLVNADLIRVAEDGRIQIGNKTKVSILKDLYYNGVISRWHYPNTAQVIFQEWIDQGLLEEKSTLLSQQEADYFSYFLNREKYTNGFDIRNKYAHGNGQIVADKQKHKTNYEILLKIMTILIIKINDDFWLYDKIK